MNTEFFPRMTKIICRSCGNSVRHYARQLCKRCYAREIAYPKYRERICANHRRSYQKHRLKKLTYNYEYRQKNRERMRLYDKEHYWKNRDKLNARDREYYHTGNSNTIRKCTLKGTSYWFCGNGKPLHRVIAEKVLGRRLKSNEVVHHIDGDGLNNAHTNLLICTKDYHNSLHARMRRKEV